MKKTTRKKTIKNGKAIYGPPQRLVEPKRNIKEDTANYLSKKFDVNKSDILSYNGGICYSTIWVRTKEVAKKISDSVKKEGRTANGGMFHGMPLGGIIDLRNRFSVSC